jgi:outer membrane immunogenic protein
LIGAAALLFAGPALAADMTAPAYKAPASAPSWSWTGWYIGANAGFGTGQSTSPDITTNFANTATVNGFPSLSPKGFVGGGQIGYDWQVSPNWVLGVVADFQGTSLKASADNTVKTPFSTDTVSLSNSLDFLGTGRMRVGYASGNWLLYGSGGFAYGDVSSTLGFKSTLWDGRFWQFSGSRSETLGGWALGAGLNYAMTRNWIWGVDYLHYDLGRTSVTNVNPCSPGPCTITAAQKVGGDVVRGVINYKF